MGKIPRQMIDNFSLDEAITYPTEAKDFDPSEPVIPLSLLKKLAKEWEDRELQLEKDHEKALIEQTQEARAEAVEGYCHRVFDLTELMVHLEGAEHSIGTHRHRFIQCYYEHLESTGVTDSDAVFTSFFRHIHSNIIKADLGYDKVSKCIRASVSMDGTVTHYMEPPPKDKK